MLLNFINGHLYLKVNTDKGKEMIESKSLVDIRYPTSTTRRGRLNEGGKVMPTLTANETEFVYIEYEKVNT